MYELENVLRPYAWGSTTAIAGLLGRPASGGPEAELWIGAHPDSPSVALSQSGSAGAHAAVADHGGRRPLDTLIAEDPEHHLGRESVAEFGPRLPFLLKVLAADSPLSLQVHPTLDQARDGFAREEAAGVDRAAAERNYKDDHHKPEMILALTPFEALCGFRPAVEARAVFQLLAADFDLAGLELPPLVPLLLQDLAQPEEHTALRSAFERLINGGEDIADATSAIVAALVSGAPTAPYQAELSTVVTLNERYPGDPGVLISLLLNRISLAPGEAVYLPAGNVHAYLHGLGIEVMASSDNVLRGGLTPKFVDVPELLRTVSFDAVGVPMILPETTMLGQEVFRPPFREFQLQRVELEPGADPVPLAQEGPAVIIVVSGAVLLDSPKGELRLERGGSAFLPAAEAPVNAHAVSGATGTALAFAVTTALKG
ncbi:mannose-6-phosphate isomerase, class I [Arthrobacter sp. Leaf69]|uniref:mannose-6-phosphate isomerase, class I n=1 Tax=Arthrobacter sp. Leaf69 TaxID=1736232 RepID=UPI0006F407EE|nr:mannose-6-phosphate isomerase, class I [Arthrobacter sp. Leaf69]KQN85064.1 mannose-6-phosphate isomerase [Arthrobacter sp. Leaf69]